MDIKKIIEELIEKVMNDEDLLKKLDDDPTAVLEKLFGVDLPNDKINDVIDAVKAKITMENIGDAIDAIGDFFNKKDKK
ncbi:MAG: hypothetical protein E7218_05030 [Anaerofustis stercorihominis]|nr:hypothetical protein [Anaerofustis stercorihominis]